MKKEHIYILTIEEKISVKGNKYFLIKAKTHTSKIELSFQIFTDRCTFEEKTAYSITYEEKSYGNVIKTYQPSNLIVDDFYEPYTSVENFLLYVEHIKDWIESLAEPYKSITKELYERYGLYSSTSDKEPYLINTGATYHHHAGKFGLIAHIHEVTSNAIHLVNSIYHKVNPNTNLVLAGALLHDIGKFETYKLESNNIPEMSALGEYINHLPYGLAILQTSSYLKTNTKEIVLLQEIIGSHHGKVEFGAIATPKTIEAIIVHQADLCSYYTEAYLNGLNTTQDYIQISDMKIINPNGRRVYNE